MSDVPSKANVEYFTIKELCGYPVGNRKKYEFKTNLNDIFTPYQRTDNNLYRRISWDGEGDLPSADLYKVNVPYQSADLGYVTVTTRQKPQLYIKDGRTVYDVTVRVADGKISFHEKVKKFVDGHAQFVDCKSAHEVERFQSNVENSKHQQ